MSLTISDFNDTLKDKPRLRARLGNVYETTLEYPGAPYDQVFEFDGHGCIKVIDEKIFADCDGVWNQEHFKSLDSAILWIEEQYKEWNV